MSRKLFRKMVTPVAVSMMLAQASSYAHEDLPKTFELVPEFHDEGTENYVYPLEMWCAKSGNQDLAACKSPEDCLKKIKNMLGVPPNGKLGYGWMRFTLNNTEEKPYCILCEYKDNAVGLALAGTDTNEEGEVGDAIVYISLPPEVLAKLKDHLVAEQYFYQHYNDKMKKKFLDDLRYYVYLARGKTIGKWAGGLTASGVIGYGGAKCIYDAYGNPVPELQKRSLIREPEEEEDEPSTEDEEDENDE